MTAVEAPRMHALSDEDELPTPRMNGTTATPVLHRDGDAMSSMSLADMEARCGGCKKVIDQENGGIVVAFGSSLWHVDCFRCAKCNEKVSADTNLLLLSDGNPVCGNCSYQCFVCKQAITEEAIMTGDESYHAHCFTCRTCKRRIEELVFAKTSQGIYCMTCHNERVARSRRHAEAKRQRQARKDREKEEQEARVKQRDAAGLSISGMSGAMSTSSTSTSLNVLANAMGPTSPTSSRGDRDPIQRAMSPRSAASGSRDMGAERRGTTSPIPSPMRAASPMGPMSPAGSRGGSIPPSPAMEQTPMLREKSNDSRSARSNAGSPTPGASPNATSPVSPIATMRGEQQALASSSRNNNNNNPPRGQPVGLGVGLGVPTSKADKRRSINPGMTFNMDVGNATFNAETKTPSPLRTSFNDKVQEARAASAPDTPTPQGAAPVERMPSPAPVPTSPTPPEVTAAPVTPKPTTPEPASEPPTEPPSRTSPPKALPEDTLTDDSSPTKSENQSTASAEPEANGSKTGANGEPLPRIDAPDLPHMSFSLSDPDFAVLLNEMEGAKEAEVGSSVPAHLKADSEAESPGTSDAEGSSMTVTGLSRSSKMNVLASAANGEATLPTSASRSLLSPHDTPAGDAASTLRHRPSKDSILSVRMDPDSSFQALAELLPSLKPGEDNKVAVNFTLLSEAVREHQQLKDAAQMLKQKYTGAKRSSQQYSEGLTVAGEEYDKEVAMRRDLEAEVTRLRAQVHGQTARLSLISSDERRAENMKRRSQDLASNLSGLEKDISRLRTQRDIQLAEVEEIAAKKGELDGGVDAATTTLGRSLSRRLEKIKEEYREELGPLSAQREALQREINELRDTREQFLEESTALAAKNEELAELNAQLVRQTDAMQDTARRTPTLATAPKPRPAHQTGRSPSMSSIAGTALQDVPEEVKETARVIKVSKPEPIESAPVRRFKWMGGGTKKATDGLAVPTAPGAGGRKFRPSTEMGMREHQFQQHSTMRLGRCELCQEKMWGLQEVKCASCGIVCHSKCADKLPKSCSGKGFKAEDGDFPLSMFGRDLSEQAVADGASVPVIVTKCIRAVEANGMEYEGIYRKTGGSSQSKQITHLFERGNYDRFDLTNVESFNDISSITSVLKMYFRQLPDPLLTHALHESFVAAANIRDQSNKHAALCALLQELPKHHYNTLKVLMLHLNRVTSKSEINLMTSQNLGVVFGPTLLRSADPNREFGDMAGKALSVQWMVENAPGVFMEDRE